MLLILEQYYYQLFLSYFCVMFGKKTELTQDDFYLNEQGYRVFTKKYHTKRGYCCKSGCKHCPYGYNKNTDTVN